MTSSGCDFCEVGASLSLRFRFLPRFRGFCCFIRGPKPGTEPLPPPCVLLASSTARAKSQPAKASYEELEAELTETRAQRQASNEELTSVKEMLSGNKRPDARAQRMHALDRQKAQLERLLDNAHRELAVAMNQLEVEGQRFNRLLQVS